MLVQLKRMSVKLKTACIVFGLIMVSSVGLTSLAYYLFANELKGKLAREQTEVVGELALHLDRRLSAGLEQITAVASSVTPADLADKSRLQQVLGRSGADAGLFASVCVVGPDGRGLVSYLPGIGPIDEDGGVEQLSDWFGRGKPFVSEPYPSRQRGGQPVISFVVPVKDGDGRVIADVVGQLPLTGKSLFGNDDKLKIGEQGALYLLTGKRQLAVHPDHERPPSFVEPGQSSGIERAAAGIFGTAGVVRTDETADSLIVYRSIGRADWVLAARFPLVEMYGPIFQIRNKLVVAIIVVDLLLAVIAWWLMSRVAAPLIRFAGHIRELSGKPPAEQFVEKETSDELGELVDAFNAMVFDLAQQRIELERNEQQFRTIVEFAHDLIVWIMPDQRVLYITPNCHELTGYDDIDFYTNSSLLRDLVHPEDRQVWDNLFSCHAVHADIPPVDLRFVCRDGTVRWMNHTCRVVSDELGQSAGIRGSFRDISERVDLESRLEEEKSFVENLIRNATLPIFVLGRDHRVLFWNRACEELTGVQAQEMIGTMNQWQPFYSGQRFTMADHILDGTIDRFDKTVVPSAGVQGGFQAEGWFPLGNSGTRYIVFDAAPVRNLDGEVVAAIETLKDMTYLKDAEEEVRKLSRAIEQNPNSIVITDTEGRPSYVNPSFCRITGYNMEEAMAMDLRLLTSGEFSTEAYATLRDAVVSGGEWRGEIHNRRKNGEFFWESASVSAIKDHHGTITHFVAIMEDITERKLQERELQKSRAELQVKNEKMKQLLTSVETSKNRLQGMYAELQAAQAQMLQREKMASIGQLAAGVAHEINNPMGFISSNLGTLDKYVGRMIEFITAQQAAINAAASAETGAVVAEQRKKLKIDYVIDDSSKLIHESLDGTERVRKIVQNLKTFSRIDEAEHKPASINECIESTLNIVWNEIKYKAEVVRDFAPLPDIPCYPQQLNQVFMNLLVNAAHAIDQQGTITIRSWVAEDSVFVSISDTGCGMSEEIRTRIFEPFFTTKDVGKGTGLGLSISYDIVRKHGGDIQVVSDVGKGTTFTVRLPVNG